MHNTLPNPVTSSTLPVASVSKQYSPVYETVGLNRRQSKWKALISGPVVLRKNKSLSNLKKDESTSKSSEEQSHHIKSIQKRISKIFRSSSRSSVCEDKAIQTNQSALSDLTKEVPVVKEAGRHKIPTVARLKERHNEVALRNLSFTAAMMAKESVNGANKDYEADNAPEPIQEHAVQIPSSTLRFWSRPSEEKLRASVRRSTEVLQQSQRNSREGKELSSMLSLFNVNDVENNCCNKMQNNTNNNSNPPGFVVVPGYDRALSRYLTIVASSGNNDANRKERTHSVAYEYNDIPLVNINNGGVNCLPIRECRSSGYVNTLGNKHDGSRSTTVPPELYELEKSIAVSQHDLAQNMKHKYQYKNQYTKKQQTLTNNHHHIHHHHQASHSHWRSKSPPSYKEASAASLISNPNHVRQSRSCTRRNPASSDSQSPSTPPQPPPRSDSLIRSFKLICNNLTESILEPRGDNFKVFKTQSDYQAWLRNLPYHNPTQISALLRRRSQQARRQCLSELLIDTVQPQLTASLSMHRSNSWPTLSTRSYQMHNPNHNDDNAQHAPSVNLPAKRCNSLSKVKKSLTIPKIAAPSYAESPSLNNYSRLYSLRKPNQNFFGPQRKSLPSSVSSTQLMVSSNYMDNCQLNQTNKKLIN